MSDGANPQAAVASAPAESDPTRSELVEASLEKDIEGSNGAISAGISEAKQGAPDAHTKPTLPESANDEQPAPDASAQDKAAIADEDISMANDIEPAHTVSTSDEPAEAAIDTPASASKPKTPVGRRKSGGVPDSKKKLNKKASKAKMTHTDAKPGDYFYVKLKGYPLWPAIVCDEEILPSTLIKSRPLAAALPDGSYREGFDDGGPKAKDRSFPVMYLHTNEFGWIPNYDLVDLDFDTVGDISGGMRKDLAAAHQLAADKNDLTYFKGILATFMAAKEAELAAKEAKKLAAKDARKDKKSGKRKSTTNITDDDGDVEMQDTIAEGDGSELTAVKEPKSGKKRKSELETNPSESSSKKIRISLKNTPKAANGTSTPKPTKEPGSSKKVAKAKKPSTKVTTPQEPSVPKEPELSAEEKRAKKEKEILFLRHKLQKGLLTRDQAPIESEMKQMSEFVSKLEGYADLEVSIIRATKINKVLKAILKLSTIPKEEEMKFKPRSQNLLDKWNKLLASDQGTPAASAPTFTNGASAETNAEGDDTKASTVESTNGVSAEEGSTEKSNAPVTILGVPVSEDAGNAPGTIESSTEPLAEDPPKDSIAEPLPVQSTA